MSVFARLAKSSFVYTATNVLQRGVAFLLLPLYTRVLTPQDYGILAVVSSISGFLLVVASLGGLGGAISRFYFDYRDHPPTLACFSGTLVTLTALGAGAVAAALLAAGPSVFGPVLGEVPFWPYMALGIGALAFQPLGLLFLNLLQTMERARTYAAYTLVQFGVHLALVLTLVLGLGWGAEGPLAATLASTALFYVLALVALRREVVLGVHRPHMRDAFVYTLPLVPHILASQITATIDKVFLNKLVDAAAAGLYHIGLTFGMMIAVVVDSIHRAFVPIYMDAASKGEPAMLREIAQIGLLLTTCYCLAGGFLACFSREIVGIFVSQAFAASQAVVPPLAFAAVLNGLYVLFVSVLFYDKQATRWVPVGTAVGAGLNVALNLAMIPPFGLVGAAWASLAAQALVATFIAVLARRYETVPWPYARMAALVAAALAVSLPAASLEVGGLVATFAAKLAAFGGLFMLLNFVAWGSPLHLLYHGAALLSRLTRRETLP